MPDRDVTSLPIKQDGIDLPEPTQSAQGDLMASCVVTGYLIASLKGCVEFRLWGHEQISRDGREDLRRQKTHNSGEKITEVIKTIMTTDNCRLFWGQK